MSTLDRIDRKILQELSIDARQTNLRLAERVGLSPSACLRRVQELERSGVITGYRVVLDSSRLGVGLVAYVAVGLAKHTKECLESFESEIGARSEVVEFHTITGAVEYLLRVEVHDMKAYKVFHTEILGALPNVSSITSYVVMDSPKSQRST